jgi:hypothetical protein
MILLRRSGGALTSSLLASSDNDRTWIDLIDQVLIGNFKIWEFGTPQFHQPHVSVVVSYISQRLENRSGGGMNDRHVFSSVGVSAVVSWSPGPGTAPPLFSALEFEAWLSREGL